MNRQSFPQQPNTGAINTGILADEISHTVVDIFNTIRRFIHVTWHSTASTLISCIGGNSNIVMLSNTPLRNGFINDWATTPHSRIAKTDPQIKTLFDDIHGTVVDRNF